MLEWLILGGGVHGTHLSLALRARGVPEHHLRVLDPHPRPLAAWDRRARSIGMPFLRSPDMHHIDLAAPSLHLFAHRHAGHRDLIRRYHRPSLALFSEHVEHVVTRNRLDQLRLRGQATRIDQKGDTFRVDSDQGQLHARRLVIAVGAAGGPRIPSWAAPLLLTPSPRIAHVFSDTYDPHDDARAADLVVLGGGLSAVQLAIARARDGARVTMLSSHPLKVSDFDPEPCWSTDRCLRRLARLHDPTARRRLIEQERRPGTVPPEVARQLSQAVQRGQLCWREDPISAAHQRPEGLDLHLQSGAIVRPDRLLLATGLRCHLPSFLAHLAEAMQLPIAPCGAPWLTPELAWAPRIYVSGALAELQLGPAAGNIIGARLAARRIASSS